ncbi:hypothetical protein [Cohnella hashimotonis]|uniref:Uncharacterized protein n=1 Tax=Cohnella hashimotonis TaxID=2826895 RepID=A0ABT6TC76_9BACL|nr:hypothetical protein [Cohnella hashimotonis]MDI4644437.1 hypothetical protein [Cohnella hashimotonis]
MTVPVIVMLPVNGAGIRMLLSVWRLDSPESDQELPLGHYLQASRRRCGSCIQATIRMQDFITNPPAAH